MEYSNVPDVSIIIPIYNSAQYITACLDSVKTQKFCNYEMILIDDGSTDQTKEVVKKYLDESQDTRFSYYENGYNFGPSFSRNKGLYISRGKYICFCDSDDILHPEFLETMIHEIPGHDFIYCGNDIIDMQHQQIHQYRWPYANSSHEIKASYLTSRIHFSHSACLYNRLFLLRHGLAYNTLCRQGEDIEFVCNILLMNPRCKCVPKSLYTYRMHPNSLSTSIDAEGISEIIAMLHRVRHKIPNCILKLKFVFGRHASHAYHIIKDIYNMHTQIRWPFTKKMEIAILSLYYIIHKNKLSRLYYLVKFIES